MGKRDFLLFSAWVVILITFIPGCASTGKSPESQASGYVFNRPYDEVWDALEDLVFNDLGCVQKKINKKKGLLKTGWVHRIDTQGTTRWMISAEVKKKKEGIWMLINKDVQNRDKTIRKVQRYRQQQDTMDKNRQNKGWKKAETDFVSTENLYRRIREKLKTKPGERAF